MFYYTHLAFSFLIGLFLLDYLPIENKFIFFLFVFLFSSFPDIDKANSKIGKKFGALSKIIGFIFGHREIFHSLLFMVFGYILLSVFSGLIAIAFLIAVASHLVLDALTPKGIMPFYPLKYKVRGVIKTGGLLEKLIFVGLIVLFIVKLSTGHI
ncbi:MAG: metal-dependent hydrolase [Nanoarchaeota archaeon]|nr:metal-dependent hydrolase [Nanoarchaeota archaeon]